MVEQPFPNPPNLGRADVPDASVVPDAVVREERLVPRQQLQQRPRRGRTNAAAVSLSNKGSTGSGSSTCRRQLGQNTAVIGRLPGESGTPSCFAFSWQTGHEAVPRQLLPRSGPFVNPGTVSTRSASSRFPFQNSRGRSRSGCRGPRSVPGDLVHQFRVGPVGGRVRPRRAPPRLGDDLVERASANRWERVARPLCRGLHLDELNRPGVVVLLGLERLADGLRGGLFGFGTGTRASFAGQLGNASNGAQRSPLALTGVKLRPLDVVI